MKKLLIAGDSFAADWTKKYEGIGWVNMLCDDYVVENIAEAGVSEYKIYKQLLNQNLFEYDYIIVSHTSAYRIPIEEHPIHRGDILHNNCDLIFSDVQEHIDNHIMKTAYDFYSYIFNPKYFVFINSLIHKEIKLLSTNLTNITFFDSFYDDEIIKLENIFLQNKGTINHMNEKGNRITYKKIKKILNG